MSKTLATVEGVMAIAFEMARIREQHGAQSGLYLSEVRTLRAEVERLAAKSEPTAEALQQVSTARGYSPEGSEAGNPSTPAAGNFSEWARVWHDTASSIATIAGGDPNLDPAGMIASVQSAAQSAPTEEMSPEFTDTARAALLWVLWHHQGASSKVGQPIRFALGMDQYQPLSEYQVREAKRWEALGPTRDAANVPPGEWQNEGEGLTPKQAWWAGYRVGKGLPPDMPRSEAVAQSAPDLDTMRTDFHQWCATNGYKTGFVNGGECPMGRPVYEDHRTHAAWWAFQKAAKLYGAQSAQPDAADDCADAIKEALK